LNPHGHELSANNLLKSDTFRIIESEKFE